MSILQHDIMAQTQGNTKSKASTLAKANTLAKVSIVAALTLWGGGGN